MIDNYQALKAAMKDVFPAIVSDSMLMGALKAALPCAYDGEGYLQSRAIGARSSVSLKCIGMGGEL